MYKIIIYENWCKSGKAQAAPVPTALFFYCLVHQAYNKAGKRLMYQVGFANSRAQESGATECITFWD